MKLGAGARVAGFVALLAVIFGAAALAGSAIDPGGGEKDAAASAGSGKGAHDAAHDAMGEASGSGATSATHGAPSTVPAGVSSTQDGYRLVAGATRFSAGKAAPLRFRILGPDGATVRDFDTEQARRMHVIVVRRDLRRYQHLHPTQGPDGVWTTPVTLPEAGVYRAFADFQTQGAQHTLGTDLFVAGDFDPLDLPEPSTTAEVDGYEVKLHERAGRIGFLVRRSGKLVTDLQPYLGARGHLVALRQGDLAYQHVHPDAGPSPEIAFHTGTTEPGTYRLFLQFRHQDRVHTAAFTRTVTS
jgi:hypothetical protein